MTQHATGKIKLNIIESSIRICIGCISLPEAYKTRYISWLHESTGLPWDIHKGACIPLGKDISNTRFRL